MARERRHYPVVVYLLTVVCALGLAAVALGIVDGWVPIAAGVAAISVALARLHVILQRRRAPQLPSRGSAITGGRPAGHG